MLSLKVACKEVFSAAEANFIVYLFRKFLNFHQRRFSVFGIFITERLVRSGFTLVTGDLTKNFFCCRSISPSTSGRNIPPQKHQANRKCRQIEMYKTVL